MLQEAERRPCLTRDSSRSSRRYLFSIACVRFSSCVDTASNSSSTARRAEGEGEGLGGFWAQSCARVGRGGALCGGDCGKPMVREGFLVIADCPEPPGVVKRPHRPLRAAWQRLPKAETPLTERCRTAGQNPWQTLSAALGICVFLEQRHSEFLLF